MIEGLGYVSGRSTWAITPSVQASGCNICVVQHTPVRIGALQQKERNGIIHGELKFSLALPGNVTLPVLSEGPATLEIDQFNQMLIYLLSSRRVKLLTKFSFIFTGTPRLSILVYSPVTNYLPHSIDFLASRQLTLIIALSLPIIWMHSTISFLLIQRSLTQMDAGPITSTFTSHLQSHILMSSPIRSNPMSHLIVFNTASSLYHSAHDIPLSTLSKDLRMTSNPELCDLTYTTMRRSGIRLCSLDHSCCTHHSCCPKHQ